MVSWSGEPDPPLAAPSSHHDLGLHGELLGHRWQSAHTAGQRERTPCPRSTDVQTEALPPPSQPQPRHPGTHPGTPAGPSLLFSFVPCGAQLNLILWLHSELAPGDFSECPLGGGGWGRGVGRTLGRALGLGPRPLLSCAETRATAALGCGSAWAPHGGRTAWCVQCPRAVCQLGVGVSGDHPAQQAAAGAVELGCLSSHPSPASHRCVTQAHH